MTYHVYGAEDRNGQIMTVLISTLEITDQGDEFDPENYFRPGATNIEMKGEVDIIGEAEDFVPEWFEAVG